MIAACESASRQHSTCLRQLAAAVSLAFGASAAGPAAAATWIATSCADSGPGTLRNLVTTTAASGDTVDLTALSCSQISLSTGAIIVNQADLTIQGPGVRGFHVFGNLLSDSIFDHEGTGTLTLNDLFLDSGSGHVAGLGTTVAGGCVFSYGTVSLVRSALYGCQAYRANVSQAAGGCVFAAGNLILVHSALSGCVADGPAAANVVGGGAWTGGNLLAKYGRIENNVSGVSSGHGGGGGAVAVGNLALSYTTVSNNSASYKVGGIEAVGAPATTTATITNSTISGNSAPRIGGLYSTVPTTISNSTIAFNRKTALGGQSAGATFSAANGSISVDLHSTLFSDNTYTAFGATAHNDVSIAGISPGSTVTFVGDASKGNANLVQSPDASVAGKLPADTITGTCALLGRLRLNGGESATHALYSGSPALDAGVNAANLNYEQRGNGYFRQAGARTDIGAYEVQAEEIFNSGFEGCQ